MAIGHTLLQQAFASPPVLQIVLIITLCRLGGMMLASCGQPRVIGEIATGILLGPLLLIAVGAQLHALVFPTDVRIGLGVLGEIGLVLLLFQVGLRFETGHLDIRRESAAVIATAIGGVVLSFCFGGLVGVASHATIAPAQPLLFYVLFCGVALSITALPVLARIIAELGLEDSVVGHLGIGAAAVTDVIGWLMLAAIVTLSSATGSSEWTIGRLIAGLASLVLTAWAVWTFTRQSGRRARLEASDGPSDGIVVMMLLFALLFSWLTTQAGLHGALGGLLAGILLRALRHHWETLMAGFVNVALVPLYFASAGLKIKADNLLPMAAWPWLLAFLAAATFGKVGGSYLAARLTGMPVETARTVAILMNTRGLVEVIVLSVGLDQGLISPTAFFVLLIVAIFTTLMTAPLVRFLDRGNPSSTALSRPIG